MTHSLKYAGMPFILLFITLLLPGIAFSQQTPEIPGDCKAVLSGNDVTVSWITATESDLGYFIIQRSLDGYQFVDVDTLDAANQPHSYHYTDIGVPAGRLWYRIATVGTDGAYSYSTPLTTTLTDGRPTIRLSPNPSPGLVYIELNDPALGRIEVSLSSADGKTLHKWLFEKNALQWTQSIDPGSIPAGTYFISIRGLNIRQTQSLIRI